MHLCSGFGFTSKINAINNLKTINKIIMSITDILHKVQLIDGEFTPSEACFLINTLIEEKINFHKLHRLSICEGNILSDTTFDDSRVEELIEEKDAFRRLYQEAKTAGKKLKINGVLEVEILD